MADHLIPYVEFLGLPGSGKSYYSHKVAEMLRAEGYKIAEPSWELDHTNGRYIRVFKKMMMAWAFTLRHRREAKRIKGIIDNCGLSNTEVGRFKRNILYKAYLLSKSNESVIFFDEGLAQMAVSLSVDTDKKANQLYDEMISVLSFEQNCLLIRIDCSIETALLNMDTRTTHDSYVEQLTGLDAKKDYLNRYKSQCDSISSSHSLIVPFNQDDSVVVSTIVTFIKTQFEK